MVNLKKIFSNFTNNELHVLDGVIKFFDRFYHKIHYDNFGYYDTPFGHDWKRAYTLFKKYIENEKKIRSEKKDIETSLSENLFYLKDNQMFVLISLFDGFERMIMIEFNESVENVFPKKYLDVYKRWKKEIASDSLLRLEEIKNDVEQKNMLEWLLSHEYLFPKYLLEEKK